MIPKLTRTKKSLLLALAVFFSYVILHAQGPIAARLDTLPYRIDWNPYIISASPTIKIGDNENLAGKVLSQQFSNIVTGQASTTIGNFASVAPAEGKIDFAGSLIVKNRSVLTTKVSGKATDGFLAIFENSRLNTQVSIDVKYHLLSLNNLAFSFNRDTGIIHDQKVRKLKYEFDTERLAILHERSLADLEKKNLSIRKEIDSLTSLFNNATERAVQESLQYEIAKREVLQDSVANALRIMPSMLNQLRNLHAKKIGELERLSFSSAVEGFEINWLTFGYKANNNKFKLFYPASSFLEQVVDTGFVSHEANVQWSYYKWHAQGFKTLFAALGGTLGFNDNFHLLDKREISETTNYGPTNGARSTTKKYDAYEGAYERDLVNVKLYGDLYYFLFNKNAAALHFNPEWVIKKGEKPVANCYAGLLLSYKKKDEETSIVNAELYYQFLDVFKTTDTDYKLFERNTIGLRFTFPIQFKYK